MECKYKVFITQKCKLAKGMFICTLGRSYFCTTCCTNVACSEGNHPVVVGAL